MRAPPLLYFWEGNLMEEALEITSAEVLPALLDLPWQLPLREWPEELIAALPRGISRHMVRFVKLDGQILAVKEIDEALARHEYDMLRQLNRLNAPCVEPLAVISHRFTANGEALNSVLITHHLPYSLPYRAVFGQAAIRHSTVDRLIDALAVLIVRLHLHGYYWGDISLSNTLFRRDAGEFAAYLVDAETGSLQATLSAGRRENDVDIARTNIVGELLDLQAGGILDTEFDAIAIGNRLQAQYSSLWNELTSEESFALTERWRVDNRIRRLNELGFDVGELAMKTDRNGTFLSIRPKVVDAGHYSRKLMRLTGLDVEEKQARRMMNNMEQFRMLPENQGQPLSVVAHQWLAKVYEPTVRAIPRELRGKLQPAQLFHEILDHRWFIAENAGHDISLPEAVQSYIENVLKDRPNEAAVLTETDSQLHPDIASSLSEDWSGYMA